VEQDILKAAESLFLEKGFALTSTTEIARRVGCNQALVHYYFRTKEKLFEAIFEQKIMVFISSFIMVEKENVSFEVKLKHKIESHFNVLFNNQQLPFFFINEIVTNPSRISTIKAKLSQDPLLVYSQFSKELEEEIVKGKIRPVSAIDIIILIFSLNVTIFLIKPVIKELLKMDDEGFNLFAKKRMEENVTTILQGLKK
jgi:TetR/AcrR family transcriptional regulator